MEHIFVVCNIFCMNDFVLWCLIKSEKIKIGAGVFVICAF
jgi:hypothetical protein